MTAIPKRFPVEFVIFEGERRGKVVGRIWYAFATDWDIIEEDAARAAREWDAEIDIHTGSVMPSGKVGTFERAGVRVRPA
jgi:hypothetical protein